MRLTRFADASERDCRVWAAAWQDGLPVQELAICEPDAFRGSASARKVQVEIEGHASLGEGFAKGKLGRLFWDLTFEPRPRAVRRIPFVPEWAPLGTHVRHPHAECLVTGQMTIDGKTIKLDGGQLTMMHIWGHHRVEFLRWAYAVAKDGTHLELTAVKPKQGLPLLAALSAALPQAWSKTGLLSALRASVSEPRPGILEHGSRKGAQFLRVRFLASPDSFAGWQYKQPDGAALHVAQSDVAKCLAERYVKVRPGWVPKDLPFFDSAALELHGPDPLSGFSYRSWEGGKTAPLPTKAESPSDSAVAFTAPLEQDTLPMCRPARAVALGLTYRAHVAETGSRMQPVIFEKSAESWAAGNGIIRSPQTDEMLAVLAKLDPALPGEMAHFGFLPAMLDYEVELALFFPNGVEPQSSLPTNVGLLLANDVTARSVQILGEGHPNVLDFWAAAKSFPGFLLTGTSVWMQQNFDWDSWPNISLTTRVNGDLRQQANVRQIFESPRLLLQRVLSGVGPLPAGSVVLTGTPAGVAMSVPAWKRALGRRLFSRVGRLQAALGSYITGSRFLRPGDEIEVDGGPLGSIASLIE